MTDPTVSRLVDFLTASPTSFHAVEQARQLLEARGFQAVDLTDPPSELPAGFLGYIDQGGTLFAFRVGARPVAEAGWRIVAAHTDSPNLRVKPQPLIRSHGYVRLGVETYGGVQVATWVDRDLGMAGLVHVRSGDGAERRLVNLDRPLCRVPTVAIHLNREVNSNGLKLNAQTQLPAVLSLAEDDGDGDAADPLRALLGQKLDVDPDDVLTWDLGLYDLAGAKLGGANDEFVFSGRLDNLASCHAALEGLLAGLDDDPPAATSVVALFDHEEIGSQTLRGANSRALENVLHLLRDAGPGEAGPYSRALAHSWLLSADMAHAIHPAWTDKHDAEHMPKMNAGPVIKQNVNHRYSTEGETSAMFVLLCERAEVPVQWYVHRTDMRCGSTVGPMLSARLGVRSIDVGNAMLSMHSAREQCGAHDHPWMARAMGRFLLDDLG